MIGSTLAYVGRPMVGFAIWRQAGVRTKATTEVFDDCDRKCQCFRRIRHV